MVKEIHIFGREQMRGLAAANPDLPDKVNIISINCPEDPALFQDHPQILTLFFHDIEHNPPSYRSFVLFDQDHADLILDFVDNMPDRDQLFIHCFAGVSRSGAVGTFLREYLDTDYEQFAKDNKQICPNNHVLQTLRIRALERGWKR